ncbi:phosphatidylinositol 4,5-bisphosphate 3-kinase catalytic subunit gamma isoform [Brachionichthys hirsutus]|uniref:phosphatidylinositol 4,5-bisphosphate 3-kinase catalytic subunit gamma isoform n=1 Tax=Brachionichthys hirsutus TaxID=412623 RepID=UPI0036043960
MDPAFPLHQAPIPQHLPGLFAQGRSETNLKFICHFMSEPGPLPVSVNEDYVHSADCELLTVILPAQCNVEQLRLRIYVQAQKQNCHPEPVAILTPEKYTLMYSKGQDWYEAYDDCQIIRTLDIPWSCDESGYLSAHIVVKPVEAFDSEERKKQQRCLAYLIGYSLNTETSDRLGEVTFTRRKLASPRTQELRNRESKLYTTEPWITCAPLPSDLEDHLKRKLSVFFYYRGLICFSIQADFNAKPSDLLDSFQNVATEQVIDCDASDKLVLKVCGREEFISGNHPLISFLWVRQCMKDNNSLHLFVLNVSELVDETVRFVDWPLVDGSSGQFSSHDDLCLEGRDLEDIVMISLRDCNRNLRVKLLGFDIPKVPNKCHQSVYVKVSILYGNKVYTSVSSSAKPFSDEVLWNEWLDFDILLRDLPRGAKLGFTVIANSGENPPTSKESKTSSSSASKAPELQKGKGKVLYFVNFLLIDHRSVLSQGPHTLYMWPFPDVEEMTTYEADKLSSATNPDITDSMAISFILDRYSFPVVLPNSLSSPVSRFNAAQSSSTQEATPVKPVQRPLTDSVIHTSTDLSAKRACFKRFREESILYASYLPHYLRNVNWMNHRDVEYVHWLLGNFDPVELDITVALELLSMDFPDEVVRRVAVVRLESLSNDDLLKYLLQLMQTLKVEPYHDSFIARYLLRRALQSKRIGHFFFWYVRSEVAGGPYFCQRMAVILEAYLLGCGQAMINSFTKQVQTVEALHEVALMVKSLYAEKADASSTVAEKLQEYLRNCNLPNKFLLPYDPRVKAGRILLDKCKVMPSKKKPLWLEFCPMPSPIPNTPVGIIFKQGDDLRQDMLIIQSLVLMDSIWKEKSLDLNLIPYGCIATGHNVGMIEIVRNAVTIAQIQKAHGGSIRAFRNDALSEWLHSKSDHQERFSKILEKFVKSCAGYCVATYVLGIGDRHNDNIMITDEGNLLHIDFGHILGNTKHFCGVNRERAPFVLTPDFLFVMGRVNKSYSLNFKHFKDTCTQAYLSLRTHSRLLVTLFSLMLLTGIPELSAAEDMKYLRVALQESHSEEAAKEHFLQQIVECENAGWAVQANWWIHMMANK